MTLHNTINTCHSAHRWIQADSRMDAFHGLTGRELGVHIVYQDEIVATHVVRKSPKTLPNIGYRSGVSTAVMSREFRVVALDRA